MDITDRRPKKEGTSGPEGQHDNDFPGFSDCFSYILDRDLQNSPGWTTNRYR